MAETIRDQYALEVNCHNKELKSLVLDFLASKGARGVADVIRSSDLHYIQLGVCEPLDKPLSLTHNPTSHGSPVRRIDAATEFGELVKYFDKPLSKVDVIRSARGAFGVAVFKDRVQYSSSGDSYAIEELKRIVKIAEGLA